MNNEEYQRKKADYLKKLNSAPQTGMKFTTVSGEDILPLYTPDDVENIDYLNDLGFPGQYPFTRGIHASGYRGRIWTMRQFAGFGTPEDTNRRFHYLLSHGQTGLSVAYDLPTLMGWDAD
ncbi:MAG TPA: methylmalonyl-CoA mutase family protein, partial [Ignavibacteriaceae bacterium]|nr:methylmalonyl-CoA mutase family protein [Ignavibacteriaceae bacterium]